MSQHTHVWTHENQSNPVDMTHHHGFGERVLKASEVLIDLDGVEPAEIFDLQVRWYHLDDTCWLTPGAAEKRAKSILAAVAKVRAS